MPDDQQPSEVDPIDTEVVPGEPALVESAPESHQSGHTETGYTEAGVPTFDAVREKIENRYGTALGATELAEQTPEGRSVAEQYEARQQAAAEKLKQIRESMNRD